MKNSIIIGLISLVSLISLYSGCSKKNNVKNEIVTKTTYDTIPVFINDTIYYTVNDFKLDSNKSITDTTVFTYYKEMETVKDGQRFTAKLKINTFSPSLKDITIDYQFKGNKIHSNTVKSVYKVKNKVYLGFELNNINDIYAGVDFAHKKGLLFGVSVGYNLNNNQKIIKFSLKKKLKLW